MDNINLNLTNASEWFCCPDFGYDEDYEDENKDKYPVQLSLSMTVGRLLQNNMAPVTTFCAPLSNNNPNHNNSNNALNNSLNNLNRTKSLDNLNFAEKRQLIASTLSLADIIHQSG